MINVLGSSITKAHSTVLLCEWLWLHRICPDLMTQCLCMALGDIYGESMRVYQAGNNCQTGVFQHWQVALYRYLNF